MGLEVERKVLQDSGYSPEVLETLLSSRKASTKRIGRGRGLHSSAETEEYASQNLRFDIFLSFCKVASKRVLVQAQLGGRRQR